MSPSRQGDSDLLRLVAKGDHDAFLSLYRRHQGGIYRFALHMAGDPSMAEEVTQEVFMQVIRQPGQYQPERGSLAALLYGIARNLVLHSLERSKRYLPLAEEGTDNDGGGVRSAFVGLEDPLADLTRAETIERVRQAVLALPPVYREVVVLCDLEELDYAQTARALACPVGTVRSRLHRARSLLMEKLRALQGGEISLNRNRT